MVNTPRRYFFSRRWLQLSLRSFLVLTVLTSLAMTWGYRALIGPPSPRPDPQQQIVPTDWDIGGFDRKTGAWKKAAARNVKWVAPLGSQTYGAPVVFGGKVFVGTNNGAGYLKRYPRDVDLGVLLCFAVDDGRFLWQHSNEKLPTGRVHDWPLQGVCSRPWVEDDRLWYVTNRCEVVCLDTDGFHDGENDGPLLTEPHESLDEADVVWKLDMMGQLGVSPHNMSACNVLAVGRRLFVCTSNGLDESHIKLPKPDAPSFLCLDKNTGEVLWSDNSPGKNILHGQWGSPAYGVLGGAPQVLFPGGDGWLYSFDPAGTPEGKSKLLWKFDCNPKTAAWMLGGRGTRNNLVATPILHQGLVYISTGQDPEHGEGAGLLWCIDPTRRGDVSPELVFNKSDPNTPIPHKRIQACDPSQGDFTRSNPNSAEVWRYTQHDHNGDSVIDFEEQFHRSIGYPAIKGDLLLVNDFSGLVHCLDVHTGKPHWTYDQLAACWSSPTIFGDHLYTTDEDGDVAIFPLSADPAVALPGGMPIIEIMMDNSLYATPTAADNVLYITNKTHLFAIAEPEKPTRILETDGRTADEP
ncbi:MAG: PQQ-binding-like beta-propeller repeat protein [Pirellulaceae bacterium]